MNNFTEIVFDMVLNTLVAVAIGSSVILNMIILIFFFSLLSIFDRDSK